MENVTLLSSKAPWPFVYEQPPKFTPFWFERVDTFRWKEIMLQYPNVPWFFSALYLISIFALQSYMKDRPPIKSQRVLNAWNIFLAVFSAFGCFRISQELMHNLSDTEGYYGSLCKRQGRNLPADFWGLLFVFSKLMELGDTYFIVLRKQTLVPLQWYHHSIVTVFAWKLYPWGEPILSYYAAINYGVHMFMYAYFALRGFGIRIPEPLAMAITSMQILQMVINTWNNFYTLIVIQNGHPCSRHPTSIKWSLGVYISLWILFAKFFIDRYYNEKEKKEKKSKKI